MEIHNSKSDIEANFRKVQEFICLDAAFLSVLGYLGWIVVHKLQKLTNCKVDKDDIRQHGESKADVAGYSLLAAKVVGHRPCKLVKEAEFLHLNS